MTPDRPTQTTSRRRVLGCLVAGASAALAGCGTRNGNTSAEDDRETVSVDPDENPSNTSANASGASAAAANAQLTGDRYAVELDALELRDHELVVHDDYRGATIEGVVANTGRQTVRLVEVHTRVYDADGNQLGRYLDSTHDLAGGGTWSFSAIVLETPSDIAAYDVGVVGSLG